MSDLYGAQHRRLQQSFATEALANALNAAIVTNEIGAEHRAFIETRVLFFLTTIDHRGYPTCSHKGGDRGFVRVLDNRTLAFPSFDGNGMFLSMGNISANAKVGLLFIDFETPHRVRIHGNASIDRHDPLLADIAGAELVVRIKVEEIFVNCPRYIHRYQRLQASKYVPQANGQSPLPQWKRIDALQPALPARDRQAVATLGSITPEEYAAMVMRGEG